MLFSGQMSVMLKQYRQANNDTESISSVASTNASIEFELSRMKHSMEKVKKENEDLKEKLFQVTLVVIVVLLNTLFIASNAPCTVRVYIV